MPLLIAGLLLAMAPAASQIVVSQISDFWRSTRQKILCRIESFE